MDSNIGSSLDALSGRFRAGAVGTAVLLLAIGVVLLYLAGRFDGFGKGLLQGAGAVLALCGVVLIGAVLKRRPSGPGADGMWLPSEDGPADGR